MARLSRETFTVTTVGTGHPDYSSPVTDVPIERALTVVFPEREIAARRYNDAAQINFTGTQQEYVVGTNANAAKSGSWPAGVVAKKIAFYATQNCYIRLNEADAVQHPIPASTVPIVIFESRVEKFYVVKMTTDGILYAWIEG